MSNKILMYHSVGGDKSFFTVTPKDFAWQMEYLQSKQLKVVPISQMLEDFYSSKREPGNTVALTFDDAYQNIYTNVLPVIQKYKFQISIFVPTSLIGKNHTNGSGNALPIMSEEELKLCLETGLVTLYPHGHLHKVSTEMLETEFRQDMQISIDKVKELGGETDIFCFPKGKINPAYKSVLQDLGIKYALSVKNGDLAQSIDNYEINRIPIDSAVSRGKFKLYMSGFLHTFLVLKKFLKLFI